MKKCKKNNIIWQLSNREKHIFLLTCADCQILTWLETVSAYCEPKYTSHNARKLILDMYKYDTDTDLCPMFLTWAFSDFHGWWNLDSIPISISTFH